MKFDFDRVIDRTGTTSLKWDMRKNLTGVADVLPMWIADMDFTAPPAVIAALRKCVEHGVFGYSFRPESYYHAVCSWMKRRFQWEIEKNWVVCTPGVVSALNFAVQTFTQPGDRIIIQPPVYHPFSRLVENNGRQVVNNQLKLEYGRYVMDLEGLAGSFDSRTRMLILCSPHNPVGRVWSREELKALASLCEKQDLLIVSDEIHADLVLPGNTHTPLTVLCPEMSDRIVTCTAASKTFNIAGLELANIIIPDSSLRRRFQQTLSRAGILVSNVFSFRATEAAYNSGEEWLEALLAYLAGNYDFLRKFCFDRLPQLSVYPLEATYLAWLDFRNAGLDAAELKELLLQRARVWLDDGAQFGPGGEGFQRMNIACPRSLLELGLERIAAVLEE